MHGLDTMKALDAQDAARDQAEAHAKAWIAAKEAEKAAEKALNAAKADRVKAGKALAALLPSGSNVTVNGNARYTFTVSPRSRVVESKVLTALASDSPQVAARIETLKAAPANRTAYDVIGLKREKV